MKILILINLIAIYQEKNNTMLMYAKIFKNIYYKFVKILFLLYFSCGGALFNASVYWRIQFDKW